MEMKLQLLLNFLESETTKTIDDLKDVNAQLKKLTTIADDEFSLDGNAETGGKNKLSIIDGLKFQKAMYSGILSQNERFTNVLKMTEDELNSLMASIVMVRAQNKARKEQIRLELDDAILNQNSNFHVEFCPCHKTSEPWGTSENCVCLGAYILRKRMSEGMTYEEAKKYIVENECI
jgi:hypothetical protein